MISAILNGLFKVILSFVISTLAIITAPIYALLTATLPYGITDFLGNINSFINMIISYVPFVADATFIPLPILKLMVDYLVFKYTIKFSVMSVKFCVKWYNALKG